MCMVGKNTFTFLKILHDTQSCDIMSCFRIGNIVPNDEKLYFDDIFKGLLSLSVEGSRKTDLYKASPATVEYLHQNVESKKKKPFTF